MSQELFNVQVEVPHSRRHDLTPYLDLPWDVSGRDPDYGDVGRALERSVADVLSAHFLHAPLGPVGSMAVASSAPDDRLIELIDEAADRAHRYRDWPAMMMPSPSFDLPRDLPWLVVISVPLGTLLASFMTEAGKDAYRALKDLVGQLHAKVRQSRGMKPSTIELHDPELELRLDLVANLPDQAYRDLCAMELPRLPEDYDLGWLLWREEYGWILTIGVPVRVGHRVVGKAAAKLLWLPTNRWHVLPSPDHPWETDRFLEGLDPSDRQAFEAMRESLWPGTKKRRAEVQRREDAVNARTQARQKEAMRIEAERRRPPGPIM